MSLPISGPPVRPTCQGIVRGRHDGDDDPGRRAASGLRGRDLAVGGRGLCADREPRLVRGARLGRGSPGRHPARPAAPDRPCSQPVPHVGGHVGRLGDVRPGRAGLPHDREAPRDGRRGRPERGHQLRGISHPQRAVRQRDRHGRDPPRVRQDHGVAVLRHRRDDHRRATRPAALGNRIAAAAIAYGLADGSNEQNDYASDLHAREQAAHRHRARAPR